MTVTHLFDHIRAKFLYGKRIDISNKLTNHSVAESVVVKMEDVLHDLEVAFNSLDWDKTASDSRSFRRVLNQGQRVECISVTSWMR